MFGFSFYVCICAFPFFFFYAFHYFRRHRALFTHWSRDPRLLYSKKKKLKNVSYNTTHTFKNYFTTVFLVFSFQQNKLYPNEPYMCQAVTSFYFYSLLTSLFLPNSDNL